MVLMTNPVINDWTTVMITDRQHATPAPGKASSPRPTLRRRDGCARVRAASPTLVTGTTGHHSGHSTHRVRNSCRATRGRQ